MEESDQPEKKRKTFPWFIVLGFALLMWGASAWTALYADPEVNFWTRVLDHKDELARANRATGKGPMIYVAGGSNCAFSIHADVIEEHTHYPVANMGGSAALGYRYLINVASSRAQKGDIVVLVLEPDIVRGSEREISSTGKRVAMRRNGLNAGSGRPPFSMEPVSPTENIATLRPGAKFLGVLAAKVVRGGPLYRYSFDDLQPNGTLTVKTNEPNGDVEAAASMRHWLDEAARNDLQALAEYGKENGIEFYYTLPWEAFLPEAVDTMRKEHAAYLDEIAKYLPVLKDEMMGAVGDNSLFADTGYHMTFEAGRERSRALAKSLMQARSLKQR